MAAAYHDFTSARVTNPDLPSLIASLRATVAPDVGVQLRDGPQMTLKKGTPWTAPEVTAAQTAIDGAPAWTPLLEAQRLIDAMSIYDKARDLELINQLNILRAALRSLGVTGLPDITAAQAITAIRNRAATL